MRKHLPEMFKKTILRKQKHKCAICSVLLDVYDIDHIIPYRIQQTHTLNNLQALCPTCHARKTRREQREIRLYVECEKTPSYRYCWTCKKVYSSYFGCCDSIPDLSSLSINS